MASQTDIGKHLDLDQSRIHQLQKETVIPRGASLDVARTLEQSASKRLFNSKAELMETIGVGILVGCLLGIGYGIIMLIESGSKSGV